MAPRLIIWEDKKIKVSFEGQVLIKIEIHVMIQKEH